MRGQYRWYKFYADINRDTRIPFLLTLAATSFMYYIAFYGAVNPNTVSSPITCQEQFKVLVTHGNLTQDKTTGRFFLDKDLSDKVK